MSKRINSRYSLFKNFEGDVFGRFLFKMKRRDITRRLFSYSRVLNRVKPLRLADLLIKRKKRIKLISSSDAFRGRKFRHYYGFGFGKKTIFFKKFHKLLVTKYRKDRLNDLYLSIEGRVDVLLLKLNLFSFINESRSFIKDSGVLVNSILIKNPSYVLNSGDILSFPPFGKFLLQRKLYRLLRSRPSIPLIAKVNKELNSIVTFYSWAFKRRTGKSPFMMNGFPRYIEPNFNTMEFYFYGKIKPEDIVYPFKTRLYERSRFFSSLI